MQLLSPLIAYDWTGDIVATLDHYIWTDERGIGHLVDIAAYEAQGGRLKDVWYIPRATGSGTWPEWLPAERLGEFKVDRDKRFRHPIRRLIHRDSGHVRDREAIEEVIERRYQSELRRIKRGVAASVDTEPPNPVVDLRDVLGGPGKPLQLDHKGRTLGRSKADPERYVPAFQVPFG